VIYETSLWGKFNKDADCKWDKGKTKKLLRGGLCNFASYVQEFENFMEN